MNTDATTNEYYNEQFLIIKIRMLQRKNTTTNSF